MPSAALRETIAMVAEAIRIAHDDWWIIASAAVALHGAEPVTVGDVDLLVSEADARRLIEALRITPVDAGHHPLFRSAIFTRWTAPPLTVEIMAGFHVATRQAWTPVVPRTRVPVIVDGQIAYVPDRPKLAAMLRLFGRPKDLERAQLL